MLSNRNAQIITVHEDEIRFGAERGPSAGAAAGFELAAFLDGDHLPEIPCAAPGPKANRLLMVPDHWLGQAEFPFQSRKRSVVEPFAERQLRAAHPELPLICAFYEYRFKREEGGRQLLSITYLQEPRGYRLYERLEEVGLVPHLITTPALLWEHRLQSRLADFADGGRCLIQMTGQSCFLYFFFDGWFLFSRNILLPDLSLPPDERFGALVYELNQSFYLFSQKARADVAEIHLLSPRAEDPGLISELLGRTVQPLGDGGGEMAAAFSNQGSDSPAAPFAVADFASEAGFRGIAHRQLRRELDWKPVQVAATVIGVVALVLIAAETLFLWAGFGRPGDDAGFSPTSDAAVHEKLAVFNDAIAFINVEAEKPSAPMAVAEVMRSLPAQTRIETLALAIAEQPAVRLKGVITAPGPEAFEMRLGILLERLNRAFAITPPLGLRDVDCRRSEGENETTVAAGGRTDYAFSLEFGLR